MSRNFPKFAELVQKRFQKMAKAGELFVVDIDGDTLWQYYLDSFPEGTNPIFRERTEHDCNCCKNFIRRVAGVVDGDMNTVWDKACDDAPEPYDEVAEAMRDVIQAAKIVDVFRTKEGGYGAQKTLSTKEDGSIERWNHFFTGDIPRRFRPARPDAERGDYRTTVQVFQRGLEELDPGAIETVLALIDANNLYRGSEHRKAIVGFQKVQKKYRKSDDKDRFAWTNAGDRAARFRNSVIGTLVQDMSSGMDVDAAVRAFETKVAPQNYKRTSAVITPGMVKEAMKTIADLDLEPALERRYARIDDISVNDVLWVDSSVRPLMKDGIGSALMAETKKSKRPNGESKKAQSISIEDFMRKVLPGAKSLDLMFSGTHLGNLMSLTAPVNPEPRQLFRWNNDFAWSYAGDIADSIKERVKRAGGRVTGVQLRASLSWYNFDDLDIHAQEPEGGAHICYYYKRGRWGELDVDMNAGGPYSREPVENITWRKPTDGVYKIWVNQYCKRESIDVGFVVEIENDGKISHFHYPSAVRSRTNVKVVELKVRGGVVIEMKLGNKAISTNAVSQEKWGLTTEDYVRVNAVTLSPNFWGDNAVGNKHHFFVLDGAQNDEPTRGIYNEFLHPRLEPHRKVFEVIGDKTKCQPTEGQLSGLGFSSTKKDSVLVRVDNQRVYRVNFGA